MTEKTFDVKMPVRCCSMIVRMIAFDTLRNYALAHLPAACERHPVNVRGETPAHHDKWLRSRQNEFKRGIIILEAFGLSFGLVGDVRPIHPGAYMTPTRHPGTEIFDFDALRYHANKAAAEAAAIWQKRYG